MVEWKEKLRSTALKRFCKTNDRCPSAHGASCEKVCQNKWWSASGRLSRHEKVNKNKLSISSDKGDLSHLVTGKMWRCSTQHSGSRCTCSIESHFWCVWGVGWGVYVWSMWECVGDNNAANYGWRTICSGFHLGTPLVPVIPILIVVCIETFENLQQSRQNSNCYCPVFGRLMMIKMKMKW